MQIDREALKHDLTERCPSPALNPISLLRHTGCIVPALIYSLLQDPFFPALVSVAMATFASWPRYRQKAGLIRVASQGS